MTDQQINEIRTAFADAGQQRDDDAYVHGMRCLSFLTSGWLTVEEAQEAVEYIGPYNTFKSATTAAMLEAVEAEADFNALVAIGRESSPVLYIETDNPDGVINVLSGNWPNEDEERGFYDGTPDELAVTDTVSIYRGEHYEDNDVHSMCGHDGPPVAVEDFAEPDPDRDHVRAWWD